MNKNYMLSILGSLFEWYDIALFSAISPIIFQVFFPYQDNTQFIIIPITILLGYLLRPVGGLLFGMIGDIWSRELAVKISLILIGFTTISIGILPSYNTIGITAPIMLFIIRALQGVSLGGEFTSILLLAYESTTKKNRVFQIAIVHAVSFIGAIMGMISGVLIEYIMSVSNQYYLWRIPFIIGGLFSISIIYIGSKNHKHDYNKPIRNTFISIKALLFSYRYLIIYSTLSLCFMAFSNYFITIFFSGMLIEDGMSRINALVQQILISGLMVAFICFFGFICRYIKPKKVLKFNLVLNLLLIPLVLILIQTNTNSLFLLIIFAICLSPSSAIMPALLISYFPIKIRGAGFSFSWNIGMVLFGATCPLILSFIYTYTLYSVIYICLIYVIITIISLYSILYLEKTQRVTTLKNKLIN